MSVAMLCGILLYVAVGAAAVGVEHSVELSKTELLSMIAKSREEMSIGLNGRFTYIAGGAQPASPAPPTHRPWLVGELESLGEERVSLNITFTTNGPVLLSLQVEFTDNTTLSTPDFRIEALYVDDAQHSRYLVAPMEVSPMMGLRLHTIPLPSPFTLSALDNIKVRVFTYSRFITTLRYNLDPEQLRSGTADSVASGLLYELSPPFATMRTMFLIRHNLRDDTYSLWVTRRPPMPRCTVVAATGNEVLFVEHVSASGPWGTALHHMLLGPAHRQYTSPIRLTVHFYERRRSRRAEFAIPNLQQVMLSLGAHNTAAPIIATDVDALAFRVELTGDRSTVVLRMETPSPIVNALLQLRVGETQIYSNEAAFVPSLSYDWTDALSFNISHYEELAAAPTTVHGTLLFDWRKYDEDGDDALRHWVHTYGGDLRHIFRSREVTVGRRSNQSLAIRARVPMGPGTVAAAVPYPLVLSSAVAEESSAVHELKSSLLSGDLNKTCEDLGVHCPSIVPLVLLTYYTMLGEVQPTTGMSWQPLYNDLPLRDLVYTPLFYSERELDVLRFEPAIAAAHERMSQLFRAEYAAIAAHAPWLVGDGDHAFPRRWSEQDYFAARSQLTARAHNMSGTLVVIPALESMGHSGHPNARIHFNNADQGVECVLLRAVSAGEELTMNYGAFERTRVDFLFQYGILSRYSADSTMLKHRLHNGTVLNVTLTMAPSSIAPLISALRDVSADVERARHTARDVLQEAVTALGDSSPVVGGDDAEGLPRRQMVNEVASVLFRSRKQLLETHLRWLSGV